MYRRSVEILFMLCVVLHSCKMNLKETEETKQVKVEVSRYDKLMYDYVMVNSFTSMQKMTTDYAQQTRLLVEDVVGIGQVNDVDMPQRLRDYFSDSTLVKIMCDAEVKFSDVSWIEKDLTRGFTNLKRLVPSTVIPQFYCQISALNESIVVGDSIIGISLDKYLGTDYPLYRHYYYPYQMRSMNSSRIVPDCFMFYLLSEYPLPEGNKRRMIDWMVHMGKLNYVIASIMGYSLLERQIGFQKDNIAWCRRNEERVWRTLKEKDLLNSTDPMLMRSFIMPAESTPLFGNGSSDQLGVWLGARIVESYMVNHPSVSIKRLLENSDTDKILAASRFRLN